MMNIYLFPTGTFLDKKRERERGLSAIFFPLPFFSATKKVIIIFCGQVLIYSSYLLTISTHYLLYPFKKHLFFF